MLENLLMKWNPVFYSMGVEKRALREFMAIYAEHHTRIENENAIVCPVIFNELDSFREEKYDKEATPMTLLPFCLTVLSKLNIEDKNLLLVNNAPIVTYTYTYSKDIIDTAFPNEILNHWVEKEATEKFVCELNKLLKQNLNLRIATLIQEYKVNKVENKHITMSFIGRFSFD